MKRLVVKISWLGLQNGPCMERAIFAQNAVQFASSINSKFHVDETDDSHIPANVLEHEYFPGTFLAAMMLLKSPSVPQQYSNTCFA